jgi:hypothetical protein
MQRLPLLDVATWSRKSGVTMPPGRRLAAFQSAIAYRQCFRLAFSPRVDTLSSYDFA